MSHDELGDHLSQLASASQSPSAGQPQPQAQEDESDDDFITAEVEDESGAEVAQAPVPSSGHPPVQEQAYGFASQQPAYRPPYRPPTKKKTSELRAIAAPILLTVGALLLIPAFWSVLVLTGAGVPMADREDARSMAKVMLVCWPLSVSLIIPAVMIFARIAAEKKQLVRQ